MDDNTLNAPQPAPAAAPAPSLDISEQAVAPDATAVCLLNDRHGNELIGDNGERASITFHAAGSRAFVEAKTKAKNRNMRRLRTSRNTDVKTDEDLAHEGAFLRDIAISFDNFQYGKPGTYPNFKAMAYACFINPGMGWLTDQFNAEAGDWGNG